MHNRQFDKTQSAPNLSWTLFAWIPIPRRNYSMVIAKISEIFNMKGKKTGGKEAVPRYWLVMSWKHTCLDKQCGSHIIAAIVLLMHVNKVTKAAFQRQCVRLFGYHYGKSFNNILPLNFRCQGKKNNLRTLLKKRKKL